MYSDEFKDTKTITKLLPSKHDLITCLAVGGRWITTQYELQVRFLKVCLIRFLEICFIAVRNFSLSYSVMRMYFHRLIRLTQKHFS